MINFSLTKVVRVETIAIKQNGLMVYRQNFQGNTSIICNKAISS